MAFFNFIKNIRAAFAYFGCNPYFYAVVVQIFRCTAGCYNFIAKVCKTGCNFACFFFIHIGHGNKNCAFVRHIDTGSNAGFIQCARILVVNGHYFTGRFHFRPKGNINIAHLVEGEYRCFNCIVIREELQTRAVTLFADALPHCAFGCNVNHLNGGNFAEERHGTGRTRVNFNNEHFVIAYNVLNVNHAVYFKADGNSVGVIDNSFNNRFCQRTRRIYGNGVAGVYACAFDMFHNAGNQYVLAVADSVNFNFRALQIVVNKYRMFVRSLNGVCHVVFQFIIVINNFHSTAAEYIGRTHHYRITNVGSCFQSAFGIEYSMSFRTRNVAGS